MVRIRHRVAALFGCVLAVGVAAQAFGQASVVLQYNAPTYVSSLAIAGTYSNGVQSGANVDIGTGAIIVPTAKFGYVPTGVEQSNGGPLLGSPGVAEIGTNAIVDAVNEGNNIYSAATGIGPNGIISSAAANGYRTSTPQLATLDNALLGYSTWRGQDFELRSRVAIQ